MKAVPRLAATIVVIAKAPRRKPESGAAGGASMNDIRVLMIKRHAQARFLPRAYVFPGGCIDPGDHAIARRFAADARVEGPAQVEALARRVGALRELTEEAGCVLTSDHQLRVFDAACRDSDVVAAALHLAPLGRWVTPEEYTHRYDTFFYGFLVDAGRTADGASVAAQAVPLKRDAREVTELAWLSPLEALRQHESTSDAFTLPTPTYFLMHALSTLPSYDALRRAWARFDLGSEMEEMGYETVDTKVERYPNGRDIMFISSHYFKNLGPDSCLPPGLYVLPDTCQAGPADNAHVGVGRREEAVFTGARRITHSRGGDTTTKL